MLRWKTLRRCARHLARTEGEEASASWKLKAKKKKKNNKEEEGGIYVQ